MRIRNSIGYLYCTGVRDIIQFSPDCAKFDEGLGYTLKPGQCTFSGREFSTSYFINSKGVRDDEKSLENPQIIVTGDSFAMGWGVNQDETYATLIKQKTGMKVLNTAISSYGTAREMMMIKRINIDKVRYMIIQYCGNDYEENMDFYINNNHLKTMSETEYRKYADLDRPNKTYFLGKYLKLEIMKRINEFRQSWSGENKAFDKDEMDLFINAVVHSGLDLDNVQIITFIMNGRTPDDNRAFPKALKKKIASGGYPSYIKNMIVLDFSDVLQDDNYYVLDDHLKDSGHEVIADEIIKRIAIH
jgi:hypothetical protein